MGRIAERYRSILELGERTGVTPILELWGFSQTLSRLSEVAYVATETAHPQACLLLDSYHLYKGGSDFGGLAGHDAGIVLADQDDVDFGDLSAEDAGGIEAVHAGHADVHEDDVGTGGVGLIDGLLAIGGFAADLPTGMAGKHGGDHAADACVVIDK